MTNKIIIFTDLHYGQNIENKADKKGTNTHWNTRNLLEKLNGKIGKIVPGAVIDLGDFVFWSSLKEKEARYKEVREILSNAKNNIFHLIWNHELYLTSADDIEKFVWQKMRTTFELGWYKHIITDIEKKEFLQISKATFAWLEDELKKSQLPCIVYGHCPISQKEENLTYYHKNNPERAFLSNSQQVRELLEKYNCKFYISWHTHFEYRTKINWLNHVTIPSFSEDQNWNPSGKFAVFNLDTLDLEIHKV